MDEKRIAILWNIRCISGTWVYGNFQIDLGEKIIGDADEPTALNIVFGWIQDYLEEPVADDEEYLFNLDTKSAISELYDRYMFHQFFKDNVEKSTGSIPNNYITYLGDSALEKWPLLCINLPYAQRIIWGNLDDHSFGDSLYQPRSLEAVFRKALLDYKSELDLRKSQ